MKGSLPACMRGRHEELLVGGGGGKEGSALVGASM